MKADIHTQKPQKLRRSRREIAFELDVLNPISIGCSSAVFAKPLRLLRSEVGVPAREVPP